MLASALGRHVGDGALQDLQQRLLDALAGHVAGDGDVARRAADLVDLVDVDDALLGALDVEVGGLEQLQQDVLDVLADVAGLGEGGGVGHGEGHVEHAGQGPGEQRLAGAGGADSRTFDFSISTSRGRLLELACAESVVVVVDRDREDLLGAVLAHDVLVEAAGDLDRASGRRSRSMRSAGSRGSWPPARREPPAASPDSGVAALLLLEDGVADLDALIADVDPRRARDQRGDLVTGLLAEGAAFDLAAGAS